MMKIAGLVIAVLWIVLMGEGITTSPGQQVTPVADGAHIHPRYETEIAALQGTVSALSQSTQPATSTLTTTPTATRTATATSTPSATGTPTATNTAQGTANTPTEEVLATMSRTPTFAPMTNTPTRTATISGAATRIPSPPFFDPLFTCEVRTTDRLTKRLTPDPLAQSLGLLPENSVVTIQPAGGSIPFTTGSGLWYVPVMENGDIAYYILYARTTSPNDAAPGVTPAITESYLISADPSQPCIPVINRS